MTMLTAQRTTYAYATCTATGCPHQWYRADPAAAEALAVAHREDTGHPVTVVTTVKTEYPAVIP